MAPLKAELAKLPVEKRWLVTSKRARSSYHGPHDNGLKERLPVAQSMPTSRARRSGA